MRDEPDTLRFFDTASPTFSTRSADVLAAREAHWCARSPYGLVILRHREAGMLLRDRRLRQGSHAWPTHHDLQGSFTGFWRRSVIGQEGEKHRLLRRLANEALAPAFADSLKPAFDAIAAEQAKVFSGEPVEFMEDFSIPFAGKAIAVLLGMGAENWRQISHDASDLGLAMGVECKRHEAVVNAACDRLTDLARDLIGRVRDGRDDSSYIARLTRRFDAETGVDEQNLIDMIVISIFGGVDTTRSQLGLGMALLAEHPAEYRKLRADPSLVGAAVEEFIRARPTTTWVTREATEDFEFGGQTIEAGMTLHLLVHASARDPAVCDRPEFSITAKRRNHFGFGGGAHHCLGFHVARSDMASALTAIARRLASFEIAGDADFLPDSGNTSPSRLPLAYELARSAAQK